MKIEFMFYLKKAEVIVRVLENILAVLCGVFFTLMFVLETFDVIGRYLFNRPIVGAMELATTFMAAVVLLGWAYTQNQEGHIKLNIIIDLYPSRIRILVKLLGLLLSFIFFAIIAYQSALIAATYCNEGRFFQTVSIPMGPFYYLVPVGAIFICLEFIVQMIYLIPGLIGGLDA